MKISFENFGVINKGEIEQKPLTILCGENNTGKTYAMYIIYGAHKNLITESLALVKHIQPIFTELQTKRTLELDIKLFLENSISDVNKRNSDFLNMLLPVFFNSSTITGNHNPINIDYNTDFFLSNLFDKEIDMHSRDFSFSKSTKSFVMTIYFRNYVSEPSEAYFDKFYNNFLSTILESSSTLLPAERAGLNLFYSELNAYRTHLLHNPRKNDLIISKYPKPIADYIDWLNLAPSYKNLPNDPYSYLSASLQNKVLGGSYSIDETNNINFHLNDSTQTLPLHLTSSTVKTYFGLWFYLQHIAQEGDVLMIDEPELSLHPSNQRKIARLLAQIVNKGIRVVISTHSDYIVKELSSLIMLSQESKKRSKLMERFGIQEDELLSPEKVGAYLFKDNTIKAMEISKSEGIIATTFDEVIRDLSDESQTIFYEYMDEEGDE